MKAWPSGTGVLIKDLSVALYAARSAGDASGCFAAIVRCLSAASSALDSILRLVAATANPCLSSFVAVDRNLLLGWPPFFAEQSGQSDDTSLMPMRPLFSHPFSRQTTSFVRLFFSSHGAAA